MSSYLLDVNLLVALLWPRHEHHRRAKDWFSRHRSKGWATCLLTEAAFVRIVSNPAFSRDAVQPREAVQVLSANTSAKDHTFWSGDLSVAKAVAFTESRLVGHQQVTDACLLGLAIHEGGTLATLDRRLEGLLGAKASDRKHLMIVG